MEFPDCVISRTEVAEDKLIGLAPVIPPSAIKVNFLPYPITIEALIVIFPVPAPAEVVEIIISPLDR